MPVKKRKPKVKTDWIRYRITDKSGSGWKTDKWLYSPYAHSEGVEKDEIIDHIIYERESWAQWAERYTIQFWRHASPPAEVIQKARDVAKSNIKYYREQAKNFDAQLALAKSTTKKLTKQLKVKK